MNPNRGSAQIAFLLLCLLLGGFAAWQAISTRPSTAAYTDLTSRLSRAETQLKSSEAMLHLMEQEVERMARLSALDPSQLDTAPNPNAPLSTAFPDQAKLDLILARLSELEQKHADQKPTRQDRPRQPSLQESMEILQSELGQEALQEFRLTLLNPNQDWDRRVAALSLLNQFPEELGAIDAIVMQEVLALVNSGIEADKKRDLLRALDHHTGRPFMDAMRIVASSDQQSDRVREEAIDALAFKRDDPAIKAFLQQLAEHDPSEDIREEAEKALRKFD